MTDENSDPLLTGMIARPQQPLEPPSSAYDLPVTPEPEAEKREPLFNRKVMALWAAAALAAWIIVKLIAPAVFETTKASIKEAVRQAEMESGSGSTPGTIRIERNGRVITIQTDRPPATTPPPVALPAPAPPTEVAPAIPPKPSPTASPDPARR